jgi:hypothetical protein
MKEAKAYKADVSSSDEWMDAPSVAVFEVSENDAKDIVRLAGLVKENGLFRVERFDYRVSYLKLDPEDLVDDDDEEENEARVDCDCISVSATEFWFTANEKNTSVEYTVERQSIKELADHFGIEFDSSPL